MKESLELKLVLNAEPAVIYNAWLSSEGHTLMTGGEAICSDQEGSKFSAWGGYIFGANLTLTSPSEITQTWRDYRV